MREKVLGVIFALFAICFVAIIVEETFLGGRKRRRMEKELRQRREFQDKDKQGQQ